HHPRRPDAARAAREAGAPSARPRAAAARAYGASGRQRDAAFRGRRGAQGRLDADACRVPRRAPARLGCARRAPAAPLGRHLPHRAQARRAGEFRRRDRRNRDTVLKIFRDYTQAELDRQYEQRSFAPNADEIIRRYGALSDSTRTKYGEPETLAYGPTAVEALDLYGGRRDKIVAFVHGGAWTRMGKRPSAFAAGTFLDAGASYIALGFGLLPSITLPEMVAQVCRALEFLREELKPKKLVLIGHSSGAHLSACALTRSSRLA